jgi:hypothetical protein
MVCLSGFWGQKTLFDNLRLSGLWMLGNQKIAKRPKIHARGHLVVGGIDSLRHPAPQPEWAIRAHCREMTTGG